MRSRLVMGGRLATKCDESKSGKPWRQGFDPSTTFRRLTRIGVDMPAACRRRLRRRRRHSADDFARRLVLMGRHDARWLRHRRLDARGSAAIGAPCAKPLAGGRGHQHRQASVITLSWRSLVGGAARRHGDRIRSRRGRRGSNLKFAEAAWRAANGNKACGQHAGINEHAGSS